MYMVHALCESCVYEIMPCVSVYVCVQCTYGTYMEVKGQLLGVGSLLTLYLLRTEYWLSGLCEIDYYLLNYLASQNGVKLDSFLSMSVFKSLCVCLCAWLF